MADQDEDGEAAAARLERALGRIEAASRRGLVPDQNPAAMQAGHTMLAASRLDALIARLGAALGSSGDLQ